MSTRLREQPNAHASSADFEFEALNEARNYRAALIQSFKPYLQGTVLEIGAGIGQFTRELQQVDATKRVIAVEPDTRFHPQLVANIGAENVIKGTAAEIPPGQSCDAIVSVNVLEHVQTDLDELQRYEALLRGSHGHLCLFVPARPEIYAPIDRDFGHFRRYTKAQLRARLESAGFEIVRLSYFNLVGYAAWWLNFAVLRQRHFKKGSVRFYDRVVFPFVFWMETRLCAPPLGQSLLAIARPKR